MALLAVPPGAAAVVAARGVLTELIVVTLIQLLQTFVHIWGGTVMGLWQWFGPEAKGVPSRFTARPHLPLFLMVIEQGCMPARSPCDPGQKAAGPNTRERKGLRMWVPAELGRILGPGRQHSFLSLKLLMCKGQEETLFMSCWQGSRVCERFRDPAYRKRWREGGGGREEGQRKEKRGRSWKGGGRDLLRPRNFPKLKDSQISLSLGAL